MKKYTLILIALIALIALASCDASIPASIAPEDESAITTPKEPVYYPSYTPSYDTPDEDDAPVVETPSEPVEEIPEPAPEGVETIPEDVTVITPSEPSTGIF